MLICAATAGRFILRWWQHCNVLLWRPNSLQFTKFTYFTWKCTRWSDKSQYVCSFLSKCQIGCSFAAVNELWLWTAWCYQWVKFRWKISSVTISSVGQFGVFQLLGLVKFRSSISEDRQRQKSLILMNFQLNSEHIEHSRRPPPPNELTCAVSCSKWNKVGQWKLLFLIVWHPEDFTPRTPDDEHLCLEWTKSFLEVIFSL